MDLDRGVALPSWGAGSQELPPLNPSPSKEGLPPLTLRGSLALTRMGAPTSPPQARCLRPVLLGLRSPRQQVNGILGSSASVQSFVTGFLHSQSFVSEDWAGTCMLP